MRPKQVSAYGPASLAKRRASDGFFFSARTLVACTVGSGLNVVSLRRLRSVGTPARTGSTVISRFSLSAASRPV